MSYSGRKDLEKREASIRQTLDKAQRFWKIKRS